MKTENTQRIKKPFLCCFWWTWIILVVSLEVVGFAAYGDYRNDQELKRLNSNKDKAQEEPTVAKLPRCTSNFFYTVSPLQLDKINYILPLGNINVGGHVTPTDHLYFVITRPNVSGNDVSTEVVDLFSPGDITVYQVGRQTVTLDGNLVSTDYFMRFAPCREVTGLFGPGLTQKP